MSKVSIIVPARNETYLAPTVNGLLDQARGDIEIIIVLDGYEPDEYPREDKRIKYLRFDVRCGLRKAINYGAAVATGDYLMKIDAHCIVGEGFDVILQADCDDSWIVVPRRYWLDAPTWTITDRQCVDMMYIVYPFEHPYRPKLTGRPWYERAELQRDVLLDEDMSFQGSLWFTSAEHFHKRLNGMDETGYGLWAGEPEELGLKTQLGPWHGAIIRNKLTWFAHWSKPNSDWRANPSKQPELENALDYASYYWFYNKWADRAHDFEWLIDRFWPLPRWPDDWRTRRDEIHERYRMAY